MSQFKISPTPWVVDRYLVRDAEGNTIADLEDLIDLHEMPREQVNLHARLMAASPELLAALKECVYVIDPKGGRMERYALKVAGAAIAKAEGA